MTIPPNKPNKRNLFNLSKKLLTTPVLFFKLNTNVLPFILRAIKLWGVDSVNISKKRKQFVWGEFPDLIDFTILEKAIKELSLQELIEAYPAMLEGKLQNKILVDVNK